MSLTSRSAALLCAALACTWVQALAGQPLKPPPQPQNTGVARPDPRHPTLITTFSGGISLGAYQAGVNWALLELYRAANRDPRFAEQWRLPQVRFGTAAGASAGNINAVLWAIEVCTEQRGWQPPGQSLFWKMWTEVDVEDLLPDTAREGAELALLDRGFIETLRPIIAARMRDSALKAPCNIPVGITLTRVVPGTVKLDQIPVHTQRYVVPLQAQIITESLPGPGSRKSADARQRSTGSAAEEAPQVVRRLVFTRAPKHEDPQLGPVRLPLPRLPADSIALGDLLEVIKASSAFPVAFQPIQLTTDDAEGIRRTELWVDGGVFDNNPVDLALVLHRAALSDTTVKESSPGVRLLYVDPDNLRPDSACRPNPVTAAKPACGTPASPPVVPGGFRPVARLLGGAVTSAREYELFALSRRMQRSDSLGQVLTTREHRLVGHRLGAFGAFLNRAYREHDFFVGVYDALHYTLCERPGEPTGGGGPDTLCTYSNVLALAGEMKFPPVAFPLVETLARREFDQVAPDTLPERLGRYDVMVSRVYLGIADALVAAAKEEEMETQGKDSAAAAVRRDRCSRTLGVWVLCRDGTDRFLRGFHERLLGLDPRLQGCRRGTSTANRMVRLVWERFDLCPFLTRGTDRYFEERFERALRRMVQVERDVDRHVDSLREEAAKRGGASTAAPVPPESPGTQRLMEGIEFLYHSTSLRPHAGLNWGSMPPDVPTLWRWAPAYLAMDAQWDGAELGWQPVWYLTPSFGVGIPAAVRWHNPAGHDRVPHWYAMVGAKAVWRNGSAIGSLLGTRAEAGLLLFQPSQDLWEGRLRGTVALEVTNTILADRLRVGFRTPLSGTSVDGFRRLQFSLGLNDLNGLGYWIGQIRSR